MQNRNKKRFALTSGAILAVGLFLVAGVVTARWLSGSASLFQTTVSLPSDYLFGETIASRPVSEVDDVVYKLGDDEYSLEIKFEKEAFPYLAGGSVKGSARLLRNGQPVSGVPRNLVADYAPNRLSEPPLLTLCVAGTTNGIVRNPNRIVFGSHPYDYYLPVQHYHSPSLIGYVYSEAVVKDFDVEGTTCNQPLDFKRGQAEFEIFHGGLRASTYMYLDAAVSIGEVPGNDWKLALARTHTSLIFEDRANSEVVIPKLVRPTSPLHITPTTQNLVEQGEQQGIGLKVTSTDPDITEVALFSHPVRKLFGMTISSPGNALPIIESAGEFTGGEPEVDLKCGSLDQRLFGKSGSCAAGVKLDLSSGEANTTFTYSGIASLDPRLHFTAVPLADVDKLGTAQDDAITFTTISLPFAGSKGVAAPFPNWLIWLLSLLAFQLLVNLWLVARERKRQMKQRF